MFDKLTLIDECNLQEPHRLGTRTPTNMIFKGTLLEQISSTDTLVKAWKSMNKNNQRSRGSSDITIKSYADHLDKHITKLSTSLIEHTFKFSKVRGTTIKKKVGQVSTALSPEEAEIQRIKSLRPLRIPDIQDRVVHKALAICLEELLTPIFNLDNDCSFAYQKKIGVEHAIVQLGVYYKMGYKYILEADIQKFFDNVVAKDVLEKVKSVLPDDSINKLLDDALKQELSNVDELKDKKVYEEHFRDSENGIPQGNALSPLLANVYLSSFDQRISEANYKMVRYADDFVILCKSTDDAEAAFELAKEELETKLGLKLYELKPVGATEKSSKIIDPRQHRFSFLSIRFNGEAFTVDDTKVVSVIQKLKLLSSKDECRKLYYKENIGLFQALKKVNNALEGWIAAYAFVDCDNQVRELDNHVNIQLSRLFESFGFGLKPSTLQKTRLKGHAKQPLGLTPSQRSLSGIPSCVEVLKKSRKDRLPMNELITLLQSQNITHIKEYKRAVSAEPRSVVT